jgi:pimeloyl-ACP methyl ester carboxylesterase
VRRTDAADGRASPRDARRLAELLPQGRLVEIPDSYTLIPLDQPARLVEAIQQFTRETHRATIGSGG